METARHQRCSARLKEIMNSRYHGMMVSATLKHRTHFICKLMDLVHPMKSKNLQPDVGTSRCSIYDNDDDGSLRAKVVLYVIIYHRYTMFCHELARQKI